MKSFQILQEKNKGPEIIIKIVYKKIRAMKNFQILQEKIKDPETPIKIVYKKNKGHEN